MAHMRIIYTHACAYKKIYTLVPACIRIAHAEAIYTHICAFVRINIYIYISTCMCTHGLVKCMFTMVYRASGRGWRHQEELSSLVYHVLHECRCMGGSMRCTLYACIYVGNTHELDVESSERVRPIVNFDSVLGH